MSRKTTRVRAPMRAAMIAVAVAAGCTSALTTSKQVARTVDQWQRPAQPNPSDAPRPAPHGKTDPPNHAGTESPAIAGESPESEPRSLQDYIALMLRRHPAIKASAAKARAKLARIPQVNALPDPVIRAIVRPEPIQTAAGDHYFTLGVSQAIPWPAKLQQAGDVAAAETRAALEELNTLRIQMISEVERAYWQIYRLDRFLEITRENTRVLGDLAGVVDTQYRVGEVPQQDLLRVQTELAKLRDDEQRLAAERATAAAKLNRLIDSPSDRPVQATIARPVSQVESSVDQLMALVVEHNPELAAMRERVARAREQVALSDLAYLPDVAVGFEWNHLEGREPFVPPINANTGNRPPVNRKSEAGDDNWALTFQVALPIWTARIEGARRQAREELAAAQGELHDTRNKVAYRIFEAWSRVESQQRTLRILQSELIPQSRQTYEVALTAYQAGDTGFVALIDHWRRWLDFELMRHREVVELETAFSLLQREVGMQLWRAGSHEMEDES